MPIVFVTGLTAQQKGTTARWYSNKTSLNTFSEILFNNLRIKSLNIYFKLLLSWRLPL